MWNRVEGRKRQGLSLIVQDDTSTNVGVAGMFRYHPLRETHYPSSHPV